MNNSQVCDGSYLLNAGTEPGIATSPSLKTPEMSSKTPFTGLEFTQCEDIFFVSAKVLCCQLVSEKFE